MKKPNLILTLMIPTLCLAGAARADSLIQLNGSSIQYESQPYDASAQTYNAMAYSDCPQIYVVNFGFGILEAPVTIFNEKYSAWHDDYYCTWTQSATELATEHADNQLSLSVSHLSADGKQAVLVGELSSPGLEKDHEMIDAGSVAKFLVSFDIQSCDGQPIAPTVADLSATPLDQILASLDQINPSDATFCEFKAESLDFESSFENGYQWTTSSILHVDHDGSATLSSRNQVMDLPPVLGWSDMRGSNYMNEQVSPFFQDRLQDVSIQLKASGVSDPAAKQSALTAAQSLSGLLKSYGELAVTLNGHPDKNLRLQQFLDQNTAKIVSLKSTVESNLGKLGLTDVFTILLPINQAYGYVAAIDAQVNSDGVVSMSRTIETYGN